MRTDASLSESRREESWHCGRDAALRRLVAACGKILPATIRHDPPHPATNNRGSGLTPRRKDAKRGISATDSTDFIEPRLHLCNPCNLPDLPKRPREGRWLRLRLSVPPWLCGAIPIITINAPLACF